MPRTPFVNAILLGRMTEGLYPQVFAADKRDDNGGSGYCFCEGGRRALAHNEFAGQLGIEPIRDVVLHPFPTVANLAAFLSAQKKVLGGPAHHGPDDSPLNPMTAATNITTNNDAGQFAAAREAYYAFMLPNLPGAELPPTCENWSQLVDTFDDGAPTKKTATTERQTGRPTMKVERRAMAGAGAP
ncbi:MAG: hypothetical protein U0136_21620 [Bdellovibrionota bacterium]